MEENKDIIVYAKYQEYKAALDSELSRTAEGFVRIGYLLRLAADTDILRESGYKNVMEFAQEEYGLDKTQVSRFIAINARFSKNGYSDELEDHYQGFGSAKLSIMLQLPDAVNEVLTPEFSKAEIQTVKNEVDKEKSISDLEMLTEQVVINMESMDSLQKVFYQMGRENPTLFLKLYEARMADAKEYQEILAPSGEGLISVRIQGMGRMMLSVKDVDRDVSLVNVRSNKKEKFPWERVVGVINELTGRNVDNRPENGKRWWELVYGEECPVEEKAEVAPVQQRQPETPKARKESKVTIAKPVPPKVEKKLEPKPPAKKEEPPKAEEPKEEPPKAAESLLETNQPEMVNEQAPEVDVTEKMEVAPVQPEPEVTGQMELVKDFPEYLPEDYVVTEDGTEVLPAKVEKHPAEHYEIKKGEFGFELLDDNILVTVCKSAGNALLIKTILEKEFYTEDGSDCSFTKDDCIRFFEESEG